MRLLPAHVVSAYAAPTLFAIFVVPRRPRHSPPDTRAERQAAPCHGRGTGRAAVRGGELAVGGLDGEVTGIYVTS